MLAYKATVTPDLWDGSHEVAGWWRRLVWVQDRVRHGSDARHPLHVLAGEMCLPLLLPLRQRHVQRLGGDDTSVHFGHGFSGLFRRRETNKPKTFAAAALHHHLHRTITDTFNRLDTCVLRFMKMFGE